MIPFLDVMPALQFFWHVIYLLRSRNQFRNDFDEDIDMIVMTTTTVRLCVQYLNIFALFQQYLRVKERRKRRRLVKPHILIKLLHNYRF